MLTIAPAIAAIVPFVLAFHQRAVRFLAHEAGVRQFLDVGTGLAGAETGRDLVQSVDPACRVVHVDNDPMVLTHLRAFSQSTSPGAFAALDAKLTDPAALLAGAAETLDFRQPVALLLPSSLPFIPSAARAAGLVSALMAAFPAGSYLALCHVASDLDPAVVAGVDYWNRISARQFTPALAGRGGRLYWRASNWSSRAWSRSTNGARNPASPSLAGPVPSMRWWRGKRREADAPVRATVRSKSKAFEFKSF